MTRLVTALGQLRISPTYAAQLLAFTALFLKWNKSINLSSARSQDEILDHVIDSLHVVPHLGHVPLVLDVGSGGGFPVTIAAICLPETNFVALEPVHKKHAFLRTAARELALVNLDARTDRLDDHGPRSYDIAMSRATFEIDEWLLAGRKCVRPGGFVIGFEAIHRSTLDNLERYPYGDGDRTRAIVIRRT